MRCALILRLAFSRPDKGVKWSTDYKIACTQRLHHIEVIYCCMQGQQERRITLRKVQPSTHLA